MITIIQDWFRRYFSDPEVAILALLLFFGSALIFFFGDLLAPVVASVIIAYFLESIVGIMERKGAVRMAAVLVVFIAFMMLLLFAIFGLMPLLSRQFTQLFQQLPQMVGTGQNLLMSLPEHYPTFITASQVDDLMAGIRSELATWGQDLVTLSLSSLPGLLTLVIYVVLMPLLVFFFLKDKARILGWVTGYMPRARGLAAQVWSDVDLQIGNYVRGKFWEIMIVWIVSFVVFSLMGLKFAFLLGFAIGVSVVVPYVGAVLVTIPVAAVAFFQWGLSSEFLYLMIAYFVIQALDGTVLVPLLFSEVTNLHPIAIIVAVLVFGGLWGVLGAFFAIPLATLVQAVLIAWPRINGDTGNPPETAA